MTTNYVSSFITVSPDSTAAAGTVPARAGTIAQLEHALLSARPYGFTSDELLFEVHARRSGVAEGARAAAWQAFFARPHACLRASPLVKTFGWGLHHDEAGRVALYGVESAEYAALSRRPDLKIVPGMRNRRG